MLTHTRDVAAAFTSFATAFPSLANEPRATSARRKTSGRPPNRTSGSTQKRLVRHLTDHLRPPKIRSPTCPLVARLGQLTVLLGHSRRSVEEARPNADSADFEVPLLSARLGLELAHWHSEHQEQASSRRLHIDVLAGHDACRDHH
jgi:hypothetical protein